MRTHHVLWHCLKYMRHQSVYYNIYYNIFFGFEFISFPNRGFLSAAPCTTFKNLVWLNGRGLDQMEFVVPQVSDVPLGIDGTGRSFLINMKLFLIKDTFLQFPFWDDTTRSNYVINMSLFY
jgi:hypothetical protein